MVAAETYTMEIASNPELLPEVENFLVDKLKKFNVDEDKSTLLTLSVAEAAANCIIHGNKTDNSKSVKISIVIDETAVEVSLKDQGDGFKPDEVPDPTHPDNILKDHGRGIHIMKSYLSELKYNFTADGTETILRLEL